MLATVAAAKIVPPASYGQMMSASIGVGMDGAMGAMMDMTPEELDGRKGDKKRSTETLRQSIAREDPHFEERMRIMSRVMGEELGRVTIKLEPKIREGLARSMALRFNAAELRDINAFFATSSGTRFARESLVLWTDPEITKASMAGLPDLMIEMPKIMKKVEEATAHLPKPKPNTKDGAKAKPTS